MEAQARGEDGWRTELARRLAVSALMPEELSDAAELMICGGLLP
jgi:hypothetical protein